MSAPTGYDAGGPVAGAFPVGGRFEPDRDVADGPEAGEFGRPQPVTGPPYLGSGAELAPEAGHYDPSVSPVSSLPADRPLPTGPVAGSGSALDRAAEPPAPEAPPAPRPPADDEPRGLGWLLSQNGLGAITPLPPPEPLLAMLEQPVSVPTPEPQPEPEPEDLHPTSGGPEKQNWFVPPAEDEPSADDTTATDDAPALPEAVPAEATAAPAETIAPADHHESDAASPEHPEADRAAAASAFVEEPEAYPPTPAHEPDDHPAHLPETEHRADEPEAHLPTLQHPADEPEAHLPTLQHPDDEPEAHLPTLQHPDDEPEAHPSTTQRVADEPHASLPTTQQPGDELESQLPVAEHLADGAEAHPSVAERPAEEGPVPLAEFDHPAGEPAVDPLLDDYEVDEVAAARDLAGAGYSVEESGAEARVAEEPGDHPAVAEGPGEEPAVDELADGRVLAEPENAERSDLPFAGRPVQVEEPAPTGSAAPGQGQESESAPDARDDEVVHSGPSFVDESGWPEQDYASVPARPEEPFAEEVAELHEARVEDESVFEVTPVDVEEPARQEDDSTGEMEQVAAEEEAVQGAGALREEAAESDSGPEHEAAESNGAPEGEAPHIEIELGTGVWDQEEFSGAAPVDELLEVAEAPSAEFGVAESDDAEAVDGELLETAPAAEPAADEVRDDDGDEIVDAELVDDSLRELAPAPEAGVDSEPEAAAEALAAAEPLAEAVPEPAAAAEPVAEPAAAAEPVAEPAAAAEPEPEFEALEPTAESEIGEPEAPEAGASEPEASEPEASEPEASEPEASKATAEPEADAEPELEVGAEEPPTEAEPASPAAKDEPAGEAASTLIAVPRVPAAPIRQRGERVAPQDRRADPEQVLQAYPWVFDPATLRERIEETDPMGVVIDRLTDKLEYAERAAVRARLLSLRAVASRLLDELDPALEDAEAALAHAETTDDHVLVATVKGRLAHVRHWRGEYAEADRLYAEAGSPELPTRLRAEIHELAGRSAFEQGRYLEAVNHFETALDVRKGTDPDLIERIELALDTITGLTTEGWGPYPRTDEEIGGERPQPAGGVLPEQYDRFATTLAGGETVDGFTVEGLAVVESDGRQGVIDRAGQVVLPLEHAEVRIHPAAFVVADKFGLWGALGRDGAPMIELRYKDRADVIEEIERRGPATRPVV
ncbi:hypothetical protein AB0J83_22810 [Actinoplanes sp. NPDC049596]|uniref:hypothetical protein n=1 Tax=unclassified Actinoplanes TaxID=2626549 RepID=UPI00343727AE